MPQARSTKKPSLPERVVKHCCYRNAAVTGLQHLYLSILMCVVYDTRGIHFGLFFLPAIPVGVPEAGGCGAVGGQPQAQLETGESPS